MAALKGWLPPGAVSWIVSWIFSSQLVAVLAAFLRVIFYIVDETQGLVKREQKVIEAAAEGRSPEAVATRGSGRHSVEREASMPPPTATRTLVVEERPSTH